MENICWPCVLPNPDRGIPSFISMNSQTIAKNSFWFGIETFSSLFLTIFTSIVIARSVGPEKLGYFLYFWWIAGVAGTVGSLGIPAGHRNNKREDFGRGPIGVRRGGFM